MVGINNNYFFLAARGNKCFKGNCNSISDAQKRFLFNHLCGQREFPDMKRNINVLFMAQMNYSFRWFD